MPPKVVFTPDAELTAVLENDPVTAMDDTKAPIRLHAPRATSSWLASTGFPPAGIVILKLDELCHFKIPIK